MSITRKSSRDRAVKQVRYVELQPRGSRIHVVLYVNRVAVASRTVRTKPLAWLAAELLCQRGR